MEFKLYKGFLNLAGEICKELFENLLIFSRYIV